MYYVWIIRLVALIGADFNTKSSVWFDIDKTTYGTKYSRMDQVKFVESSPKKILLGPF